MAPADALAATPLAGALDAALLLTRPSELPEATATALQDLGVAEVTLVGGFEAISAEVSATLQEDYEVARVAGEREWDTAANTAAQVVAAAGLPTLDRGTTVFLANGERFPDALSSSAAAYDGPVPVLYTVRDALRDEVTAFLDQHAVEHVVLLGGTDALAADVEATLQARGLATTRLAGPTRVETSTEVAGWTAQQLGFDLSTAILARGDDFPDALTSGQLGGVRDAPIILSATPTVLPESAEGWFTDNCPTLEVVQAVGGTAAIAPAVLTQAVEAARSCQEPGGQRCTNPDDGFAVTYPFTWSANAERIDEIAPCSLFDPDPTSFEFEGQHPPADIGAQLFVDPVDFEDVAGAGQFEEEVARRDATVDGRRAERLETRATGEGMHPEGTLTTRWAVDLGGGETFLAITRSLGEPEYAQKVAVLDAMVDSLSFGPR